MNTTFNALLFKNLPNAAHYDYCAYVAAMITAATEPVREILAPLTVEFNGWLARELALMEWVRRSVLTVQIAQTDTKLDRTLVALNMQARALEYSTSAPVAAAATSLYNMLHSYGKVYSKSYDDQSGDIRAILTHLQGDYAAAVTTLGVGTLVANINSAFNEFRGLLAQRSLIENQKPEDTFPVVRKGIEGVYHKITTVADAYSITGNQGMITFIGTLNGEIERLNEEFHRAKHNIAHARLDDIPHQAYTGLAITPLPNVYYPVSDTEEEKLELGKDFNLTFNKNIKPGNASCTVHGKGKYKDRQTVTFIIE
ncbi:MAG: DUF6261 family protein [Prevotellaceae bacterium]|jgi:hypothetical protein|nr:DUF6261 family protein [Prevotellaceae bacterium]